MIEIPLANERIGCGTVQARTASVIAMLEPVYGSLLAIALLGEIPTLHTIAGGILIVAVAAKASMR